MTRLLIICLCLLSCVRSPEDELPNGSIVPNIVMRDTLGGIQQINDLRGKIVLIDFWAAWCKDCREKNPELVALYQKYKETQKFEIFSVSLDKKSKPWKKAIQKDNLMWKSHVSDLLGFSSPYTDTFKFNAIPTLFLIDENGIIIGKDLSIEKIEQEIEKRIKPTMPQ